MYSVVLAAAVNFSLDLVLCSLLGKGIVGAAWATLVSQYCAAGLLLRVLASRGWVLNFHYGYVPLFYNQYVSMLNFHDLLLCRFFDFFKMFVGKVKDKIIAERAAVKKNVFKIFGFVPFLFVMIMKMTMHNSAAGKLILLILLPSF